MNLLLPVSLAVVLTTCSAQILIQGEPVQLSLGDQVVGGKMDADVNRKDVKEIADFATSFLSMEKNSAISLVKVVKAQTQVVAGVNYFITIQIQPAGCTVDCKYEECEVSIFDQEWTQTRKVVNSSCKTVSPSPHPAVPLGSESENLEDEDVKNAVNFAVEELNKKSNSLFRANLIELQHAKKQVVAGLKYRLTFLLGDTVCRNNPSKSGTDLQACPLSDPHRTQVCHATVWYKAWETPQYKLLDSKCELKQAAGQKKPLLGGDGHDLCHMGMFKEFQMKHGKFYDSPQEEDQRYKIFCANVKKAAEYQAQDQGTARYGVTQFSDLTEEEFKAYRSKPWDLTPMADMKMAAPLQGSFPKSFDWRDHGAVTPVKNQGACGSCWAFSVTGNVEGMWHNKKGNLISLSEQELVDCDKVDQGCEGGLPANAYKQIIKLGGLETETKYKYTGHDGSCHFSKSLAKVYINSSIAISSDENQMAAWLSQNGPISIGINAFAMQFYMGGISHPWKFLCNPSKLDHGVLIVGYGQKGNKPYWIIKNSWGPHWGEKGYYYVYRGAGVCGLNTACTSAIVDA
ncbi:cathepsin L-like [Liolophura sinensis]|uniref:cathepsin L-like n=1 Tax=Liolophura sinensis TaxID=3198878 RepID=UPI003159222F